MDSHFYDALRRSVESLSQRARAARIALFHLRDHEPERALVVRRLTGLLTLVVLAFVIGSAAHHQSQTDALADWKQKNQPQGSLWRVTLKALLFSEVKHSSTIQSVTRKHPGRWDQVGETWFAQVNLPDGTEARWLTVLTQTPGSAGSDLQVYWSTNACPPEKKELKRRKKTKIKKRTVHFVSSESAPESPVTEEQSPPPEKIPTDLRPQSQHWRPLGSGWEALQSVSQLDPLSALPCTATSTPSSHAARRTGTDDPRAIHY